MQLTMREQEKMMISLAAMIAQRRKDKGIKLNHPEAVALITDYGLQFDREKARGKRLDIPAGTAIRFEPGETKTVQLIDFGGKRRIFGFNNKVNGFLD